MLPFIFCKSYILLKVTPYNLIFYLVRKKKTIKATEIVIQTLIYITSNKLKNVLAPKKLALIT